MYRMVNMVNTRSLDEYSSHSVATYAAKNP